MRARRLLRLACLLLAVAPPVATGHATLQDVGAAPGGAIRLVFDTPVEPDFVRVETPAGTPAASVDPSDSQVVLIADDPGALTWRVLSRDGHVTEGRLPATDPLTRSVRSPISVIADVATFLALLGLIGLVAVRFGIVANAWRTGGTSAPGGGRADAWRERVGPPVRDALARWWVAWWALVGVAAAGVAGALLGLWSELGGVEGALFETRWGVGWLVQAGGLLAAAVTSWNLARSRHRVDADPPAGWGWSLMTPLLAAGIAIAATGHASSGADTAIGIGTDTLHLWATGAWFGGLVALIAIVPAVRAGSDDADGTRFAAAVVVRFSSLAIGAVATLVVTGVYRAIAELNAVDDLIDTDYGRALLAKLIVFGLLLVGGAVNRLVLHPRLERAALGLRESDGGAGDALRTSVLAELGLATLLLVAVGVLVNLPTP